MRTKPDFDVKKIFFKPFAVSFLLLSGEDGSQVLETKTSDASFQNPVLPERIRIGHSQRSVSGLESTEDEAFLFPVVLLS